MKRKYLRLLLAIIIFLSLALYSRLINPITNSTDLTGSTVLTDSTNYQSTTSAVVKRVIDGDTIELESGQKVRYIGIDTPELHHPQKSVQCFGKEAMEINEKLVLGKTIFLEKDISEVDKYKRLLRYVFLPDEKNATLAGLFINQYLVEKGYAYAATFPPDVKYSQLFLQKQQEARNNNQGLWKNCQN